MHRLWSNLAMIVILVGGAAAFFHFSPDALRAEQRMNIALLLALGIPGFYLLTFSGLVEESEIEIAAMCAAAGVALWIGISALNPMLGAVIVLLPLTAMAVVLLGVHAPPPAGRGTGAHIF